MNICILYVSLILVHRHLKRHFILGLSWYFTFRVTYIRLTVTSATTSRCASIRVCKHVALPYQKRIIDKLNLLYWLLFQFLTCSCHRSQAATVCPRWCRQRRQRRPSSLQTRHASEVGVFSPLCGRRGSTTSFSCSPG